MEFRIINIEVNLEVINLKNQLSLIKVIIKKN